MTAFTTVSAAKDLDTLMRYLVPAFLVENFTTLCRANDPSFLSELKGTGTDVGDFSQHIKAEITVGLTPADAEWVVTVAANTARKAASDAVRKLSPDYPAIPAVPLQQWCREDAKPFIRQVMMKHYEEHDAFLRIIARAKQAESLSR